MRYLSLSVLLVCLLGAQSGKGVKPKEEKLEACSIGSVHHCHCLKMTAKIEDDNLKACYEKSKSNKELINCIKNQPDRCEILNKADYTMSNMCSMACKKHACRCADSMPCVIGVHYYSGEEGN